MGIVDDIRDEIVDEIVAGGNTMCIVIIAKALNLNSFVGRVNHNVYSNHCKSTKVNRFVGWGETTMCIVAIAKALNLNSLVGQGEGCYWGPRSICQYPACVAPKSLGSACVRVGIPQG